MSDTLSSVAHDFFVNASNIQHKNLHAKRMKFFLADLFNFFRKQTLRRLWNAGCLLCSYFLSRTINKPVHFGMPMTLSIEPTTACNLKCPECPSGLRAFTRETGNLKQDLFEKVIEELGDRLMYLIFYFQGEPFIHPSFMKMVNQASRRGIYTITSTNGHFFDEEIARKTVESGLDRLIISVDGTTQEVYEQYRKGGKLSVVLEGAQRIVRWKKELKSTTPHLIFQFLVVKPNEHQIGEIHQLAKEIGVDEVKLKTAQVYDYKNGNTLIPSDEQYSRYKKMSDGTYQLKSNMANHCWKLWHASVVTWDGWVLPCCFDKDAKHRLGNVRNADFKEIWYGSNYRDFRNRLFLGRKNIEICTNCTEGCTVWA